METSDCYSPFVISSKVSGTPCAFSGFYRSRRDIFGRKLFVLVTPKDGTTRQVKIARSEVIDVIILRDNSILFPGINL